MPKKKKPPMPEEQRKRFEEEARRLERSGEIDLGEADAILDELVKRSREAANSE